MDRSHQLLELCGRHGLVALYLFGSRAEDGRRRLLGGSVGAGHGSDLDIGVFFGVGRVDAGALGALQAALAEIFAPLPVDLVPLDRVDPLFQFRAIEGFRAAAPDSTLADENELLVMRRAADLLPIQRQIELERFGVASS